MQLEKFGMKLSKKQIKKINFSLFKKLSMSECSGVPGIPKCQRANIVDLFCVSEIRRNFSHLFTHYTLLTASSALCKILLYFVHNHYTASPWIVKLCSLACANLFVPAHFRCPGLSPKSDSALFFSPHSYPSSAVLACFNIILIFTSWQHIVKGLTLWPKWFSLLLVFYVTIPIL